MSELDSSIPGSSIRDCFRLGKYNELRRSRPILVKFNRFAEVSSILSKRHLLDNLNSIKPVLSHEERVAEGLLLKEWWSLIQSGI